MNKMSPRSFVVLIIPALIGATVGATLYRVAFRDWDMLGWLAAAFVGVAFLVADVTWNQ